MKEIAHFFWVRWKRACQMDAANKLQGKPTHYWIQSEEWTSAYKQTLSKSKQRDFEYEWNKLEEYLERWHNAPPKKQDQMKNPMEISK